MGYSIAPISANCYPCTAVLINKFDIKDEEKLNEVEAQLAAEEESAKKEQAK